MTKRNESKPIDAVQCDASLTEGSNATRMAWETPRLVREAKVEKATGGRISIA